MAAVITYESIDVGAGIKPLIKHPDAVQLVKWAGAAEDYYPIHFDKDFALSQGLPGVIVHGDLMFVFLTEMLQSWVGPAGELKKISVNYRRTVVPEQDLCCKGVVVKKYVSDGEKLVECEIWLEDEQGQKAVTGTAVVSLK
jgi:acyl dehydratase